MKSVGFSIKVYKQYFNFAASHFLLFKNGEREPLHGHNYRVELHGEAPELSDDDMLFDFLDIKPIVREVCDSLDHKLLLPRDNPFLTIKEGEGVEARNYLLSTRDESFFSIPKKDVLILPLPNTSAERLAAYLCEKIIEIVDDRFSFRFSNLKVEVEETPGQSAVYQHRE